MTRSKRSPAAEWQGACGENAVLFAFALPSLIQPRSEDGQLRSASTDLIATIRSAVGIATTVGRIAVAAETVAKSAMLMAAMETTEVSGHVATTEAAAEMTAAETATMAPPTTAPASECGS